ncbi:MAG: ABC transporter permease [Candidatus Nanopelagicales bacterium]
MTTTAVRVEARQRPAAAWMYRHPRVRLLLLLVLPLSWLMIAYLGSLAALFVTAFWQVDDFTGQVTRTFTLANFSELLTDPAYYGVALRTIGIAATVTVLAAVIGLPMAFYMARIARPSQRALLVALVLTPLWASYLVKVYSWRTMFQPESGVIAWFLKPFGLDSPGYGALATIVTLTYLWLPYMILPLYAAFERIPDSYLDASADLGAKAGRTFRSIVLPRSSRRSSPARSSRSRCRSATTSPCRSSAASCRCWATSSTRTSRSTCRSPPPSRRSRCS